MLFRVFKVEDVFRVRFVCERSIFLGKMLTVRFDFSKIRVVLEVSLFDISRKVVVYTEGGFEIEGVFLVSVILLRDFFTF